MSLVSLNPGTLNELRSLIDKPASALPAALKALQPDGHWDLLTQKISSTTIKAGAVELALPLLDRSVAEDGLLPGAWKWNASVQANASLTLDLLAPDDLKAWPIRPDAGHTMVCYGAEIGFGAKLGASAKLPAWGGIGVDAAGQRDAALRWYVQAENTATLLDALTAAQRQFVWPHDLQAMLRLANRGDWFGLEMSFDGEARLAIDVDAAAQGTGWTFSLNGEQSSVGLSFGVSAGFKAARQSRWKLSVMVEPRAAPGAGQVLGLRVRLHDLNQSGRQASLQITAGADFSAVTAGAERALRAAWPELDSPLLDQLAQPGTAIAGRLRSLIDSSLDGALQGLAEALAGGAPPAGLRSGLLDKLTGSLADVLDRAAGDLAAGQALADKTVAAWLERLLGKAAGAVTVDDAIEKLVAQALTSASKGLNEGIEQLKSGIVGKAQDQVDALLKRLGELGAQFQARLDHLDDNQASQAIRDALARYGALRDKFLDALTDSHRQKLALTLSSESAGKTAAQAVFEAWFRPAAVMPTQAGQLFSALCGGRLLAVPELVAAAQGVGAVEDAGGWLLATSKTLSQQRATLNFFGVEIGSSTGWLSQVRVKTDLVSGNLLAAQASAEVVTAIANPWKDRSARLGVLLEMTGGNDRPAALAASLDGAFTASNENSANRASVQGLLDAYADATGAPHTDLRLLMSVPSESDDPVGAGRFWQQLTLAIPVTLDTAQWAMFAGLDAGLVQRTALEVGLSTFARRYAADSLFSNDPLRDLSELILAVTDAKVATDAVILEYLQRFPGSYVNRFSAAAQARKVGIDASDADGIASRGARQFLAYHRLSATVQAPLRLRSLTLTASDRVKSVSAPVDPAALRKSLAPVMLDIQQALSPVALVSETWLGIGLGGADDEPVSWPFVSFITTMAKLVGIAVPPGFVPVAQVGDQPALKLIGAA